VNNLNKISGNSFQIIKRPVFTGKSISLTRLRKYTFLVNLHATKSEIKGAIENLFDVKVIKINTSNLPRKKKRVGKFTGWKAQYKKAIVSVSKGQTINLLTT
jgi:large subunit ribosomal protein L23